MRRSFDSLRSLRMTGFSEKMECGGLGPSRTSVPTRVRWVRTVEDAGPYTGAVDRQLSPYRFFPLGAGLAGFVGNFAAGLAGGFFPFLGGTLGGGAVGLSVLGGMARMRHLGPEPMRSSRWAVINASRTR